MQFSNYNYLKKKKILANTIRLIIIIIICISFFFLKEKKKKQNKLINLKENAYIYRLELKITDPTEIGSLAVIDVL